MALRKALLLPLPLLLLVPPRLLLPILPLP